MGQTNEQWLKRLAIDGIEKLRTPRRCVGCGGMTKMRSKEHGSVTCYECTLGEKKMQTNRPFAGLCR